MKKSLFFKMLKKQEQLNDLTYPAWREELTLVDWQSAILVEAGELLDSFGYKWWKKQDRDLDNVRVELIDILHFLLSDLLYYSDSVVDKAFSRFQEGFKEDNAVYDDYEFKDTLLWMVSLYRKDICEQFYSLAKLFKYVEMDFEDVYRAYFVKNILNEFRQRNGYKKGTYIKIWKVDLGEGVKEYEDNQAAFYLAKKLPLEKLDKSLSDKLEDVYKKIN